MRFAFDCVFYYVSDLKRSVRFYSEVLGFRLLSSDVVARFDVDGALFELVPTDAMPRGDGNARLCLTVDDMDDAQRWLAARGVPCGASQVKQNGVLATFEDPDRNEICLWQYLKPAL